MKKIIICLITLLCITGCTNNSAKKIINYTSISADKAYQMIRNEDVIIIDVRTKDEYDSGHLEEAINIPYDVISNEISKITENLNQKIVIYCRSGGRAIAASKTLVSLGYESVYTFGGLDSWDYGLVQ